MESFLMQLNEIIIARMNRRLGTPHESLPNVIDCLNSENKSAMRETNRKLLLPNHLD